MKWNDKLFAAIPVFCLILGSAQTALAASVEPGVAGSIVIHSLAVEDAQQQGSPATGEEQQVAGEPLANISYTVTRVADEAADPADAAPVTGQGAYGKTVATDEFGVARFTDLALGVYLVHQEESGAVEASVADFLVDVPMTNPAGTGRIYNVNVYPKYQLSAPPSIDAFVTEEGIRYNSARLHDRSRWIVRAGIPGDIAAAQEYQVQGTLHKYLAFAQDSVDVYAAGDGVQRVTLEAVADYTAQLQEQLLTVTLLPTGRAKLGGLSGADLYVVFETDLEIPREDLETALAAPIGIGAQIRYTSSLGRPGNAAMTENMPYVYTGGMRVLKTETGGRPLEGASFKLYPTRADALAGTNAVQSPEGGEWEETTDEYGVAAFYGLAYGGKDITNIAGSDKFFLVQTAAPAGFNLLRVPVEITVDATSHLEENQVEIQGRKGFLLPATGGMGTVWFTVIGIVVIGLAVYLLWRMRKRGEKDEHSA